MCNRLFELSLSQRAKPNVTSNATIIVVMPLNTSKHKGNIYSHLYQIHVICLMAHLTTNTFVTAVMENYSDFTRSGEEMTHDYC